MKQEERHEPKDISLDIPAEANREKHIDFLESDNPSGDSGQTKEDKERRKEWEDGMREGEEKLRGE